ncbi:MAG: class I SAM-dependent methyltransferase [Deltaproteobacteria bacterium]|nr:class I SAM-dependent methyltransferase [Deltaproteobacteria bacterium]
MKRREENSSMAIFDFDNCSHFYRELLNESIWLSGEENNYFDLYKLNCLKRWVFSRDCKQVILDFGCGIGKLSSLIAMACPKSKVYGYDVSIKSIEWACRKWGHLQNLFFKSHILDSESYDLIIVANVFHHIKREDRHNTLFRLRTLLKSNGKIVVFEHNPLNPLTLYTVNTCPFDVDAVLIHPCQFVKLAKGSGLKILLKRYIVFSPNFLRFFRKFEPFVGFLPLGAQYMILFGRDRLVKHL